MVLKKYRFSSIYIIYLKFLMIAFLLKKYGFYNFMDYLFCNTIIDLFYFFIKSRNVEYSFTRIASNQFQNFQELFLKCIIQVE